MTTIREAASLLASLCDGALSDDDQGFNKPDSAVMKSLLSLPYWSKSDEQEVHERLRKYSRQLSNYDIDYEDLKANVTDAENMEAAVRRVGSVSFEDGLFHIKWSRYDPELRERLKAGVPGRRWNPDLKLWTAPASSAPFVRSWAQAEGFQLWPSAQEALQGPGGAAQGPQNGAQDGPGTALGGHEPPEPLYEHPGAVLGAPGGPDGAQGTQGSGASQISVARKIPPRNVVFAQGVYEIRFPYDEYVKDQLKELDGRRFDGERKIWTVPMSTTEQLIQFARTFNFSMGKSAKEAVELYYKKEETHQQNLEDSFKQDSDLVVEGLGIELRPFQRAGVEFAVKNERVLIADSMGLGKSAQSLATVQYKDAYPAVIVCPASLKLNWKAEVEKVLPGRRVQVLKGGKMPLVKGTDFYVLNYEILRSYVDQFKTMGLKAVICDEAHAVKNPKAMKTQYVKKLVKDIPIRLLLTGTPILNRPIELVTQLEVLGRFEEITPEPGKYQFFAFAKRYCDARSNGYGWDFTGASNTMELNKKLRRSCFIRREKMEVLKELPAKTRCMVPVEMNDRGYKRKEQHVFDVVASLDLEESGSAHAALVEFEKLKKAIALGKLKAVKEWVDDFLESGEKLVLYAKHHEVLDRLVEFWPDAARILGTDDTDNRQANKERFMTDPDCRLLIGAMGPHAAASPAGVGWTLTAASKVAFLEFGWTPAHHDQCEDRVHRIGQEGAVIAYYFTAPGTIDGDVFEGLDSKRQVVTAVTDGTEVQESDLLKTLMEKAKSRSGN